MRIGEVSRRAGIAPSAIRFYERLGILPPPARVSGQRRFTLEVLDRLALIAHGRACGIRLAEMQVLLNAPASRRPAEIWKPLVTAKLKELDVIEDQLAARRRLLLRTARCRCATLDICGRTLSSRPAGSPAAQR